MGHRCSIKGIPSGVHISSQRHVRDKGYSPSIRSSQKTGTYGRSPKVRNKRGNPQNLSPLHKGFLVNILSRTQKDRGLETNHKPQATKSIHKAKEVQDGESLSHTPVSHKRKMGYIHRPKRCVSPRTHSKSTSEMAQIQDRRAGIRVQCPPFRLKYVPKGIHSHSKIRKCLSKTGRDPDVHLSGRLDNSVPNSSPGPFRHSSCNENSPSIRVYHQSRKIKSYPISKTHVPRSGSGFGSGNGLSYNRQSPKSDRLCHVSSPTEVCSRADMAENSRIDGEYDRINPMVSTPYEADTTPSSLLLQHSISASVYNGPNVRYRERRAQLVDEHRQSTSRNSVPQTSSRQDSDHRRVKDRMGRSPRRSVSKRGLDALGISESHKSTRTLGGPEITDEVQTQINEQTSHDQIGQHHSSNLYLQTRRDEVSIPLLTYSSTSDVVRRKQHYNYGVIHPGPREHTGRQSIEGSNNNHSSYGMVPVSHCVQCPARTEAIHLDRSVCQSSQSPTSSVLFVERGSERVRSRCPQHTMVRDGGIRIPTNQPNPKSPPQNQGGRMHCPPNSSVVAEPTVVHRRCGSSDRSPNRFTSESRPSLDARLVSNVLQHGNAQADSLDLIRDRYEKAGFSKPVADMVAKGRRLSTRRVYASRLRPYLQWCRDKTFDPCTTSVNQVAEFLLQIFSKGFQLPTVKGYLAAIQSIHTGTADGVSLNGNKELKFLFEGMNNTRPPQRHIWPAWNIQLVLKFLRGPLFEPLNKASLRNLSVKTLFLIAIASGRRCSELHALTTEKGIVFSNAGATLYFAPGFLAKNELSSFSAAPIFIPYLNKGGARDQRLNCPVRALLWYLNRTKNLRGNETGLFISSKKPHKRVAKSTLANWLVHVIVEAKAIKEDYVPRAHSVRALSTSSAAARGVGLADIIQTVSWRTSSTFVRKYLHKDVNLISAGGRYSNTVLNSN